MPAGVRAVTRLLVSLDGLPGTRDLGPLAVRLFRAAPAADREALAELAEVTAWVLFEEEHQRLAHAHNLAALALARPGGDVHVLTLLNASMQRAHVGRLAEALALADRGEAMARSPKVRAMFALRAARAHSRAGRAREALAALDRARDAPAHDPTAPPWAWWVDETELAAHRAAVLANLGRLEEAAATFPSADQLRFREVVGAMRYRTLRALGEWPGPPPTFTSPRATRTATGLRLPR
ncbi:hypothetical protein [Saccharothrix obliqua]|uniref:hypothetical protein n=1 Tax=Saccharothrix obliqua TaxID=2861747 RepID=UPI001C5DFCDB|nr:hypothetical protein [Saccharothrix obliqua]MBW4718890.1 hypothetical protein [Saccharothrix obliqua]